MRSVTVVGGSLAGLSAVRALRAAGFDGRVTVLGDEVHRPYDRPPLSKELLSGRMSPADLALESEDEALDAEWRLGVRAIALHAADRAVELAGGGLVRSDGVVLATGARARTLPGIEGIPGVHTLRTLDDGLALAEELRPGRSLVVVGAGFIGAEVASTAHQLGLAVTVLEAQEVPMAGPLGDEMGRMLAALHHDNGVRLMCGVGIHAVHAGRHGVDRVELVGGRVLPADVVVVGVGAAPNVEWLEGSGVELANGVRCDSRGATSVPGVVAVGDCASWYDPVSGGHRRVEHWTGALERPAAAVATLLGRGATVGPPRPPYFWSDQYGRRIQFAGAADLADELSVEDGSLEERSFLAVYRRAGEPVAVLGVDRIRPFTRWRRQLDALARAA
ncbi:MAG TPA: FAD-dependent oxidoreductase [Actinomycetales bacterium]|nr:FAD-dependent oxidoreductase [Actinomycetales bacterium]